MATIAMASTTRFLFMTVGSLFVRLASALLLVVGRIRGARSLALCGCRFLRIASNLEEGEHAEVGLVAGVLDEFALGRTHRKKNRPRLLPRGRVADRQPELDPVVGRPRVT